MRGDQVLGHRNPKRKRWPITQQAGEDVEEAQRMERGIEEEEVTPTNPTVTSTTTEVDNGPNKVPTIPMAGTGPSVKRTKLDYKDWTKQELEDEMRKRKKKPRGMGRNEMEAFFKK